MVLVVNKGLYVVLRRHTDRFKKLQSDLGSNENMSAAEGQA